MEKLIKCPKCDHSKAPKLYVNTDKKQFICFRCDFKGPLGRLLTEFPSVGQELDADIAREATLRYKRFIQQPKTIAALDEFNPVQSVEYGDPYYKYLNSRGWTDEMIDIYQPLKSNNPDYSSWVIIPVYDKTGEDLLYYVGRDITGTETNKYKNSNVSKKDIIFESAVEDSAFYPNDLVICEGIFDGAKVPRAIALLGKKLVSNQQSVVYDKLQKVSNVYVALDSGAESEMMNIAETVVSWFPAKNVYVLDTAAYAGEDLGDLSKRLSSTQLMQFIKTNSIKHIHIDPVQSKLSSFKQRIKR